MYFTKYVLYIYVYLCIHVHPMVSLCTSNENSLNHNISRQFPLIVFTITWCHGRHVSILQHLQYICGAEILKEIIHETIIDLLSKIFIYNMIYVI